MQAADLQTGKGRIKSSPPQNSRNAQNHVSKTAFCSRRGFSGARLFEQVQSRV
jgi:hypothetical protein